MCYFRTYIKIRIRVIKEKVLAAARFFMAPIVRVMLRSGVTWSEFAELLKEVFVDVARKDYGRQGRPTNVARVAMITGLSRREVTRVRDILEGETETPPPVGSRISHILTAWHTDPDFSANGEPSALTDEGLETLLKRYAGDLPHGAVIKELIELGLVKKSSNGSVQATTRHYTRTQLDPDIVRQMGVALHDHAATLAHNVDRDRAEVARFERIASVENLEPRYVKNFAGLIEERGQSFLEEMDAWLSSHAMKDSGNNSGGVRTGVGLYLIQTDNRRSKKS